MRFDCSCRARHLRWVTSAHAWFSTSVPKSLPFVCRNMCPVMSFRHACVVDADVLMGNVRDNAL